MIAKNLIKFKCNFFANYAVDLRPYSFSKTYKFGK